MKTFVKLLLAAAGLGVVGFVVKREYDKAKKQQKQEEIKFEEELKEIGISRDCYEKEIISEFDEDNLCKKVYLCLKKDSNIDLDDIDVKTFIEIDSLSEKVIHLRNSVDAKGKSCFDILVEIPELKPGDWESPRITDYLNFFSKEAKREIEIMTGLEVRTRLEGYYMVDYQEVGDKEISCISCPIPEEDYRGFANGKNDGLVDYIQHLLEDKLHKTIEVNDSRLEGKSYRVMDAVLLFKFSLPSYSSTRPYGVTVRSVRKILEYMMNPERFFVARDRENPKQKIVYHNVMANAEDQYGIWSMSHYYNETSEGVVVDQYVYTATE